MSRDNQTLLDLARSARLIIEFQQGIDQATLATDIKTQSAMLYHFLILGEAVKRLSHHKPQPDRTNPHQKIHPPQTH
ncbi:HepT-like ribonuclease domain-containing protein [Allocoleopsis franciscana]|uniref:Uncharacterized protein n=1 Tax=Allocoleopsis franciscana PCC 7113 TaxID=1173027 RepID=K9WCK2_9CYAN|nr:hypothetical protein Mic7113_1613 [Allocoleopsis franciscana PCC 7113]